LAKGDFVNQCKQCGQILADNANYCSNCGTPAPEPPPETPDHSRQPTIPAQELDFVQPAIAGGIFLGLLSSLPIIQAGNCLCCMWVLGGGGIATYLLNKQRPLGLTPGDGAFAGGLSGLFGAFVATLVTIPVRLISGRFFESQQEALEEAFRDIPEFEGPIRDLMLRMASSEVSVVTILLTFIMYMLMFALFAMIGGILTVAILRKRDVSGQRRNNFPPPSSNPQS
jgi:hypothetical protein